MSDDLTLPQKIERLGEDANLLHEWTHGDETASVALGGVDTPSPRKLMHEIDLRESAAAQAAIAAGVTAAGNSAAAAAQSAQIASAGADVVTAHAQSIELVAANIEAVQGASGNADAAAASAAAAAASAAAAAGASTGLAPRMDAVELVAASAKAVTDNVMEMPGAGAIPKAGPNGKIDPRWSGTTSRLFASFNTSEPDGLLCNGGAYSRTTYDALFAILGTSFGAGDGSTTFNVPDFRGRTIQGASANLMAVLAAGLPDIEGEYGNNTTADQNPPNYGVSATGGWLGMKNSGAFYPKRTTVGCTVLSNDRGGQTLGFKASRHDSIYGNSTTVQPPAIAVNIYIKY